MKSKLVLIDGNAILHRAYHALPPLTTKDGELINAVYGFVSMLLKVITDLRPTHLAVCFDRKEPTFRKKEYKAYQAQRPVMDKELSGQIEKLHKVLNAFNIKMFSLAGYEADDLLGTIAEKAQRRKVRETVIVTGDRDIMQLVNNAVKVYLPTKGLSEAKIFGEKEVEEKMGVKPTKIVDYKALVGDPSDNYPGVSGIGPKTAIGLLLKYKSKNGIYKSLSEIKPNLREKLEKNKKNADISYKLATIVRDVPVKVNFDEMLKWDIGSEKGIGVFREFGFKTLLNRTMNFGKNRSVTPNIRRNLTKEDIKNVVFKIAKKLQGKNYAIRGTASMVLQGLDMGVDDIDLIADKETSLLINEIFKDKLIEEVKYSESEKFKSYYGKFVIDNILLEVMGEFQVKDSNGNWSEVLDASSDEVDEVENQKIKVTKLNLELNFSALMGRWNEFHKIQKQLEIRNQVSLF